MRRRWFVAAVVLVSVFVLVSVGVLVSVVSGFSRTGYAASGFSRNIAQAPGAEMLRVPQFENDRVVSWKSIIPPHTGSTLHRHDRYRTIIGIVGGELKTVAPDGRATVTHYETGKAYWFTPMPPGETHKDVNDTDKTIELIVVEVK